MSEMGWPTYVEKAARTAKQDTPTLYMAEILPGGGLTGWMPVARGRRKGWDLEYPEEVRS